MCCQRAVAAAVERLQSVKSHYDTFVDAADFAAPDQYVMKATMMAGRRSVARSRSRLPYAIILYFYLLTTVQGFYIGLNHEHFFLSSTRLKVSARPASDFTYDASLSLGKQVPSNANILSQDPLVYVIPNFLSENECNDYIDKVEYLESTNERCMTRSNPPEVSISLSKLWPLPFLSLGAGIPPLLKLGETPSVDQIVQSVVPAIALALLGSSLLAMLTPTLIRLVSDSSSRTSDAMALNMDKDVEFIRPLVELVHDATQHPWFAWEAPVATRYAPGAIFAQHGDASPTRGSEWSDLGGQRVVTCIVYLNTVKQGGETSFSKIGVNVKPTRGSALFFFPANANTLDADDRTIHESLPPGEEKWIVQMFGRVGRVPPPLGIPDCYESCYSS